MPKPNTLMTRQQRDEYISCIYNNNPSKKDFEDLMQINNLVASRWEDKAKFRLWLVGVAFIVGFGAATIIGGERYTQQEVSDIIAADKEICERKLNDPHHCISVCAKQWEKMGC